MSIQKVAVFGGSFDPPHNAHIEIVKEALDSLDIDILVIFPSFLNPFKKNFNAHPFERLGWVKKIFSGFKRVDIDSFEIDRGRPTPTYLSIEYIKKKYSPKKIYLIVGADNFSHIEKWENYERLKDEVEFVVAKRDRVDIPKGYKVLDIQNSVSSTKIRDGEYLDSVPLEIKKEVKDRYL